MSELCIMLFTYVRRHSIVEQCQPRHNGLILYAQIYIANVKNTSEKNMKNRKLSFIGLYVASKNELIFTLVHKNQQHSKVKWDW